MKKVLLIALTILVLIGVGMALMARRSEPEWTTTSEQARGEFESGLDSLMKFYYHEAMAHFEQALEIDPGFAAAKVLLLHTAWDRDDSEQLVEGLRQTDTGSLTSRERFLVEYTVAKADKDHERAESLVGEYLEGQPGDPFALLTCSAEDWEKRDLHKAEKHYRRLIESDPNWVAAQNRIGYIAMAQGKFDEAEEAFKKYHYIAPDQANPHDSLGELLTLTGRYEEAQPAFERALEIDPDFCLVYVHMTDLFVMSGDFESIPPLLDRTERHCSPDFVQNLRCATNFWEDFVAGEFEAAFVDQQAECRERVMKLSPFILHRLAVATDRFDFATEIEDGFREMLAEHADDTFEVSGTDIARGLLLHMEGVRLAAQNDLDEAQSKLLQADDHLLYWGDSQGILKLYNLLNLATLLRRTGDEQAADGIFEKVRSINEHFVDVYEMGAS
jgi:tetratricopeptide (TPR) repeat protein